MHEEQQMAGAQAAVASEMVTLAELEALRRQQSQAATLLQALARGKVGRAEAARLAAERGISNTHLAECREILADLDKLTDTKVEIKFEQYIELNAAFHSWIPRAASSITLERELDRIGKLPLASPSAFLEGQEDLPAFRKSLTFAQRQHRAIFDAIVAREGARAEALCREHARLARENLSLAMADESLSRDKIPGLSLVTSN